MDAKSIIAIVVFSLIILLTVCVLLDGVRKAIRNYYEKGFIKKMLLDEKEKEQRLLNQMRTDWDIKGPYGYKAIDIKNMAEDIKIMEGEKIIGPNVNLPSGYMFMYTDKYTVYIDLNSFSAEDMALVKDLLVKKYTELLDTYSQFCLEAKKNVINTMYGGEDE